MGRIRLIKYLQFIYSLLEGRIVHLQPVRRPYSSFTARQKAVQFIYSPLEGLIVHLQPVRRPYSSFTTCQKVVRFILQTVSRTYGRLGVPFRRQPRRHLGRDFLCVSFMFYSSIKAITEAIYRWFYFLSTASV